VTNVVGQCETRLDRRSPVAIQRWWIFAFVVSLLVFLSTLLFLSEEAYAKSKGGGGGSDLTGERTSGGSGGGDSAKGGDGPRGGDGPINNITSGDGNPSKRDVSGDATGSLGDAAKNDASTFPEEAPLSPTETNEKNSEPVLGTLGSVERVADTTEPAMEQASPLVKPVKEASDPVVTPIQDTVAPISETARPLLAPASEALEPVVTPIQDTTAPVVEPVSEGASLPLLGPLDEATNPVLDPLGSQLEPMSAPMTAVAPMTGAAGQMFEPVSAEGSVPFLGGDGQPYWSQPEGESQAYQTALPALATAVTASTSTLDSDTVPVAQEGNLESSASNATANLSSSYLEQVVLSLFEEDLSSLNLAGMKGTQNQVPQPFSAGGMPMAAGGFSSGSSSSSSGGSLDTSILGLLAILLLGGKFLWSTRDFLKPNAVLLLAIERPG
jgi:hypothetical protein